MNTTVEDSPLKLEVKQGLSGTKGNLQFIKRTGLRSSVILVHNPHLLKLLTLATLYVGEAFNLYPNRVSFIIVIEY